MRFSTKVLAVAALLSALCSISSAQANDPCSICPNDLIVAFPDTVIPSGTGGILTEDTTCADLESQAQNGDFNTASCLLLRTRVTDTCCGTSTQPPETTNAPSPAATTIPPEATTAPTATPTTAPPPTEGTTSPTTTPVEGTTAPTTTPVEGTTAPTTAVTQAPSSVPNVTVAPGPTPVGEPIQGVVTVRLDQVPGELSGGVLADYLASCKTFFRQNRDNDIINLNVELFKQTVVSASRRLRRRLQNLEALDTQLLVSGVVATEGLNVTVFEESLIETVNDNTTGFIEAIQDQANADSAAFFANVTTVEAFSPNSPPTEAPSAAPEAEEEDDDDKLSGGAIFGIVFGVLVALVAIVAGAKLAQSKGEMHGTPRQLEAGTPSPVMSEPKASVKKSAPVVVAATAPMEKEENLEPDSDDAVADQGIEPSGILATMDKAPEDAAESNVEQDISVPAATAVAATAVAAVKKSSARPLDDSSSFASTLRQNMVSRTITAPAGKLGIIVDTTVEGPVVHKVSETSPLEGKLFSGDIIISIDGTDTRAMSAAAITALMTRNADQERTMVVLSEEAAS